MISLTGESNITDEVCNLFSIYLKALLKAGYIDEEASKLPRVMQFQRAARTDKHVSAARQIVSMKMPDTIDVAKVNSFLPAEVRVMGVKKATKGFDCKTNCDGRTYMYMIPSVRNFI